MQSLYEDEPRILLAIGLAMATFGLTLLQLRSVLGYVLLIPGACALAWGCVRLIRLYRK
jgi:hypothetical protein